MNRKLKGSLTIEVAVIVPILLMVFAVFITLLFYYHDKNVIGAITHETLVMGCSKEEISEEEIQRYMEERMRGKLLLFEQIHSTIAVTKEEIKIENTVKKKKMFIHTKMSMARTNPEQYIWNIRRISEIGESERN